MAVRSQLCRTATIGPSLTLSTDVRRHFAGLGDTVSLQVRSPVRHGGPFGDELLGCHWGRLSRGEARLPSELGGSVMSLIENPDGAGFRCAQRGGVFAGDGPYRDRGVDDVNSAPAAGLMSGMV